MDLKTRCEAVVREARAGLVRGRHVDRRSQGPVTVALGEVALRSARLVSEEVRDVVIPIVDELIDRVVVLDPPAGVDRQQIADEAKAAVRHALSLPEGRG